MYINYPSIKLTDCAKGENGLQRSVKNWPIKNYQRNQVNTVTGWAELENCNLTMAL